MVMMMKMSYDDNDNNINNNNNSNNNNNNNNNDNDNDNDNHHCEYSYFPEITRNTLVLTLYRKNVKLSNVSLRLELWLCSHCSLAFVYK